MPDVPKTVYLRAPGAPTWRIEEILRGIGFPDLLVDQMDGHFELIQSNLITYSEALSTAGYWDNTSSSQYQYFDANAVASVQDITVAQVPAGRDPDGYWLNFAEQSGNLAQNVAVAPGEVYTLSFYAQGVSDYADALLSVLNVNTGFYLVTPLKFASQLIDNNFARVSVSFQAPAGCTFARLELISGAEPFTQISDGPDFAEYTAVNPANFISGTETLTIGTTTLQIPTATPAER